MGLERQETVGLHELWKLGSAKNYDLLWVGRRGSEKAPKFLKLLDNWGDVLPPSK